MVKSVDILEMTWYNFKLLAFVDDWSKKEIKRLVYMVGVA